MRIIVLLLLLLPFSLNAQVDILTGDQVSRYENPNFVIDEFRGYIEEYNRKVQSSSNDNPFSHMTNDIAAEKMAKIHWDHSISNEQFNQMLVTALGLYNQSLEAKRPVISYLDKLSNLYTEHQRQKKSTNVLTRTSSNLKLFANIWMGVMAVSALSRTIPTRMTGNLYSKLSTTWRTLVPRNSRRGRSLERINTYKWWQFAALGSVSSLSVALVSEGVELLRGIIEGPKLNPRPLVKMSLAYDAKNLGKMSCDLKMKVQNKSINDDPDSIKDLIEHLQQTHSFLQEYAPRFNITHDPITEDMVKTMGKEDTKHQGLTEILFKGVNVEYPECDQNNVNLGVSQENLNQTSENLNTL